MTGRRLTGPTAALARKIHELFAVNVLLVAVVAALLLLVDAATLAAVGEPVATYLTPVVLAVAVLVVGVKLVGTPVLRWAARVAIAVESCGTDPATLMRDRVAPVLRYQRIALFVLAADPPAFIVCLAHRDGWPFFATLSIVASMIVVLLAFVSALIALAVKDAAELELLARAIPPS